MPYLIVLHVIGRSHQPLSSYEIKRSTNGSNYAYKMIEELVGIPSQKVKNALGNPKYRPHNRKKNAQYQKEYDRLKKEAAYGPRFLSISVDDEEPDNRRKWRYSLNFRGFLLYLLAESRLRRPCRWRIRRVLSNPQVLQMALFLQAWNDFERTGFDVIDTLVKIGREFQDQLDYDIDYLMLRVSGRYLIAFNNYFDRVRGAGFFHKYAMHVDLDTDRWIQEFRLRMLQVQKEALRKEVEDINRWIAIYLDALSGS